MTKKIKPIQNVNVVNEGAVKDMGENEEHHATIKKILNGTSGEK